MSGDLPAVAVEREQRTILDMLLDATATNLRKYVVLRPEQADAIALWVAHTHALDAWRHTPYLRIYSVVKQSGKTRLMEVLHPLTARPLDTDGITPAALIRTVDAERPTLLLDEVDAQLGSSKEMAEALRGILNSGFKRRGNFIKCVGEGANMTTRKFKTFCPKALAGIGRLPDTVADRSIPIKLKRRASGEQVKPLFEEDWEADARPIANGFGDELEPKIGDLLGMHPRPVGGLSDRAEEAWRPLLVVADLAGGEWPGRARRAARALCGEGDVADEEIGIRLLAALQDAFHELDTGWMPTGDFLSYLHSLDGEPWGDWSRGNPITKRRVADLLRPFDIRPKQVRVGEERQRGYRLEDCEGEFSRYLAPAPAHGGTPNRDNRDNGSGKPETAPSQTVTEGGLSRVGNGQKPHQQAIVPDVTVSDPPTGASDAELLELAAPEEREAVARLLAAASPEERTEIAQQLSGEAA